MEGILVFVVILCIGLIWWLLKLKHDKTYTKILITYPFDSLKKGKVAVFRSDLEVGVGDYVLIRLPGYEMIWKVRKQEGEKLELVNHRIGEILIGFPRCYVWGKMIGYEGEIG